MPTTQGYPVSQIVSVSVILTPIAAATRNFGATLAIGSSDVIDTNERIRAYGSLDAVAADFGTAVPEYAAAAAFFSQSPKPSLLYLGRWAQSATAGRLNGGVLSVAQQAIAPFQAVTLGKLTVTVDGVVHALTLIDLSADNNLNAVAASITAKFAGAATCTWDSVQGRFTIASATTGAASTVSFAAVVAGDEGLAALMKLMVGEGGNTVDGIVAESLVAAYNILAAQSSAWYFVGVAATGAGAADADMPALAAAVEASDPTRFAGFTTQDSGVLNSAVTTDLAYVLKAAHYERSFVQYSSTNAYAVFSIFGRGATIDFEGAQTEITYKFKNEPSITGESITVTQYNAAKAKNCNVFTNLNNDTTILQEGVTSGSFYIDEVQGTDWLQNDLQVALFNALYTNGKIPQTDAGVGQLMAAAAARCVQAVTNGLAAPGTWNAPGFGKLESGQYLPQGFYIYAPPVATQSQADREARKSPTIQIALKLAGAIHFVAAIVVTNR